MRTQTARLVRRYLVMLLRGQQGRFGVCVWGGGGMWAVQVRHNMAVAEFYRDGGSNPKSLIDALATVKVKVPSEPQGARRLEVVRTLLCKRGRTMRPPSRICTHLHLHTPWHARIQATSPDPTAPGCSKEPHHVILFLSPYLLTHSHLSLYFSPLLSAPPL